MQPAAREGWGSNPHGAEGNMEMEKEELRELELLMLVENFLEVKALLEVKRKVKKLKKKIFFKSKA